MADYTKKLKSDLLEQFKESPRINALMEAIGEQLRDVSEFYEALRTERGISTGVGKQLDGVGDIVVLSRGEALEMVNTAGFGDVITDDLYRKYLYYKILKNTNTCTYPDLIKAFRLFWDKPLYYSEDPEQPAVMFLKTGILTIHDHVEDLLTTPVIKAAGVGIHVTATVQFPEMEQTLFYGGYMSAHFRQPLPEIADKYDFRGEIHVGGRSSLPVRQPLPELADDIHLQSILRVGGRMAAEMTSPVPELADHLPFQSVLRAGGRMAERLKQPIAEATDVADELPFQGTLRAGDRTVSSYQQSLTEQADELPFQGTIRAGGRMTACSTQPVMEHADKLHFQDTLRARGRVAAGRKQPVPEDTSSQPLVGTGRTGGRATMRITIPIPELE